MANLVWRVKLIAELEPGIMIETEVARIERDDFAVPETLGLTLDEGKRLMAATQAEIVRAQACAMGERFRWCEHCGAKLLSKGTTPPPSALCSVTWASGSAVCVLVAAVRANRSQRVALPCSPGRTGYKTA